MKYTKPKMNTISDINKKLHEEGFEFVSTNPSGVGAMGL